MYRGIRFLLFARPDCMPRSYGRAGPRTSGGPPTLGCRAAYLSARSADGGETERPLVRGVARAVDGADRERVAARPEPRAAAEATREAERVRASGELRGEELRLPRPSAVPARAVAAVRLHAAPAHGAAAGEAREGERGACRFRQREADGGPDLGTLAEAGPRAAEPEAPPADARRRDRGRRHGVRDRRAAVAGIGIAGAARCARGAQERGAGHRRAVPVRALLQRGLDRDAGRRVRPERRQRAGEHA